MAVVIITRVISIMWFSSCFSFDLNLRETVWREGGHLLLRDCALRGKGGSKKCYCGQWSVLEECPQDTPHSRLPKWTDSLCSGFFFPSPDHWTGLRRPRVPAQDQWLWSECGQVLWEVPSGRLPAWFLPSGGGLLWPAPRQPVRWPSQLASQGLLMWGRLSCKSFCTKVLKAQLKNNKAIVFTEMYLRGRFKQKRITHYFISIKLYLLLLIVFSTIVCIVVLIITYILFIWFINEFLKVAFESIMARASHFLMAFLSDGWWFANIAVCVLSSCNWGNILDRNRVYRGPAFPLCDLWLCGVPGTKRRYHLFHYSDSCDMIVSKCSRLLLLF